MKKEIYLDNSATTKPYREVVSAMDNIYENFYGNPSSLHAKGFLVEREMKQARAHIAKALAVNADEIIFTSGGTEANNMAILGSAYAQQKRGKHLITTAVEHPSCLRAFEFLSQNGFEPTYFEVDQNGQLDLEALAASVTPQTMLVSVMSVNNETGVIYPIIELVKVVKKANPNCLVHVDGVQAFGKIPFQPSKWGVDLATISAHKIHGPKGVGALYIKKGVRIAPIFYGGGQEKGLRAGTENTAGIVGFGKATEMTFAYFPSNIAHLLVLKSHFINRLQEELPQVIINGQYTASHIINISFFGVRGEVLLHALEQQGVYVSTGSACSAYKKTASHVLQAMHLKPAYIEGAIRISFSHLNTVEEIDQTIDILKEQLVRLSKFTRR